jgi:hypothetical protein
MEEIWKPIKGYEGFYEVSIQGRIRSIARSINDVHKKRTRLFKGRIIELSFDSNTGYFKVTLSRDNVKNKIFVHRLVAEAFIPNQESKPCVNHKDGVKINNYTDNLEWCTYSENLLHSYRTLNNRKSMKGMTWKWKKYKIEAA